ncbi:helix-turn-helix transcriptional regulator [Pedobacter sp. PAMC26386]|nr:helix-turn-helix transcriptional regulator [Pedobacter sp. PAMC26386]
MDPLSENFLAPLVSWVRFFCLGGGDSNRHADLICNYQLGKKIQQYGFFSYAVNEALFLSEKEKSVVTTLFESIAMEPEHNIDKFSQDVLVSQIELLLNYSNRFYNRQFITRKVLYVDLIVQLDAYLAMHLENELKGLPTVQQVSDHLRVSQRYLTDMLKSLTGHGTQQYIHYRLIEKAKSLLVITDLSVAEIGYQLGFEHPQSFNKLFKMKTKTTPSEFRDSFN